MERWSGAHSSTRRPRSFASPSLPPMPASPRRRPPGRLRPSSGLRWMRPGLTKPRPPASAAARGRRGGAGRDAGRRRAAAEAAIGLDEQRIAAADHAQLALADRDRALEAERDALAGGLGEAGGREAETGSG